MTRNDRHECRPRCAGAPLDSSTEHAADLAELALVTGEAAACYSCGLYAEPWIAAEAKR